MRTLTQIVMFFTIRLVELHHEGLIRREILNQNMLKSFNENVVLSVLIITYILFLLWDSDLPDLFGAFSEIIWTILSCILLVLLFIILFYLISSAYHTLLDKKFNFNNSLKWLLGFIFVIIYIFNNKYL